MNSSIATQASKMNQTQMLEWCYLKLGTRGVRWDANVDIYEGGTAVEYFFEDPRELTLFQLAWATREIHMDTAENLRMQWDKLINNVDDTTVRFVIESSALSYRKEIDAILDDKFPRIPIPKKDNSGA